MRILLLTSALAAAGAWAAEPAAPGPAPTDRTYRSAFAEYRPFEDTPLQPWREANDQVRGQPGHMGHTMEPSAPPAAPPAPQNGQAAPAAPAGQRHGEQP